MSTIPDQYKGPGYGTIYGDSEVRQAIANAEVAAIVGGGNIPGSGNGIGNKTDPPAAIYAQEASLVSLLKTLVDSTAIQNVNEPATIADCLNGILNSNGFIATKVESINNQIIGLKDFFTTKENAIRQTQTSPIETIGSGDKIIISNNNINRQIRVHSLNFIASDVATIRFKFSETTVSGAIPSMSFSSDYPHPMVVSSGSDFIISILEDNISLSGYVIYTIE